MSTSIIEAAKFAKSCHQLQVRKHALIPTPYIEHPARVAARVSLLPGVTEAMICAAWLHDVVEDCNITVFNIKNSFGETVGNMVEALTNASKRFKIPAIEALPRATRKQIDIEGLIHATEQVKLIKLCDRIENLMDTLVNVDERSWALKYAEETRSLYDQALKGTDKGLEEKLIRLLEAIEKKYGTD